MELSKRQKFAGAALLASGALIGSFLTRSADTRSEYTEGIVCNTPILEGESPNSLADGSAFKADQDLIIQRSQFINQEAAISYTNGDESSFTGSFNVLLKDEVEDNPNQSPFSARTKDNCTFSKEDKELVSTFPSLQAASKILESIVALREAEPSKDEFKFWRCGAVAVSESKLLLASSQYVSNENKCVNLAAGESGENPLEIISDKDKDQFRFIEVTGADLKPIEIAKNYKPEKDDILLYAGYSRGGTREYFRVRVEGDHKGRILVRSNIDQIVSYNDAYSFKPTLSRMHSGNGALFNMDGELVAVVESANRFQLPYGQYSKEDNDQIIQYNKALEDMIKTYRKDVYFSPYGNYTENQYIVGLTVGPGLVTNLDVSGE